LVPENAGVLRGLFVEDVIEMKPDALALEQLGRNVLAAFNHGEPSH
jgi:hypothetical protein